MDLLVDDWQGKPAWMWLSFLGIVTALLVLDLGILHKKNKEIGVRESLGLSVMYISLGLAFGGWVWWQFGGAAGTQYLTGFLVEKSLAMDNLFVIATIFAFFAIPRKYQHRVLFWGILGAIVLRAIMIGLGAALVSEYHWVLYIFAALLVAAGIKMLTFGNKEVDVAKNPVLKIIRGYMHVTDVHHGESFFVNQPDPKTGKTVRFVTPMFLALAVIEVADVIFAVDSVPAIFAITSDPFIVYTSNIFAILGLRALYFALAAVLPRFAYLKHALAILLIFIGSKIFIADLAGWEKFPTTWSLGITLAILVAGICWSLWKTRGTLPPISQEAR